MTDGGPEVSLWPRIAMATQFGHGVEGEDLFDEWRVSRCGNASIRSWEADGIPTVGREPGGLNGLRKGEIPTPQTGRAADTEGNESEAPEARGVEAGSAESDSHGLRPLPPSDGGAAAVGGVDGTGDVAGLGRG